MEQNSDFYGFAQTLFTFEDRAARIIFPHSPEPSGRWMMKMEYFGAFPSLELELLRRGWHLCYLENLNRWGTDADSDAKARFADYISEKYHLERRFTCVGMSCGGLCSVNFAARYPDYTSLLYLDAPVMNLLSCPMGFGVGESLGENGSGWREIADAYGFDISHLLTYREHPIDKLPSLAEHRIPVALVYGDSDTTVPYVENGAILEEYYKKHGLTLYVVAKEGCGHHPHGVTDTAALADFIEENTVAHTL